MILFIIQAKSLSFTYCISVINKINSSPIPGPEPEVSIYAKKGLTANQDKEAAI